MILELTGVALLSLVSYVTVVVVALTESNWTLLGVAAIGAAGSVTTAVIASGNRRRVENLERQLRSREESR